MAVKILSLPFSLAMFPLPDGVVSAADRAQLAVGYPLAASAPPPPTPTPVPEAAPVSARVPSVRIAPMVYRDAIYAQDWDWFYIGAEIPANALVFASYLESELVDHKGGRDAF